jgi:hypothetical protein
MLFGTAFRHFHIVNQAKLKLITIISGDPVVATLSFYLSLRDKMQIMFDFD